jgi:hypothetical protein
MNHRMTLLLGVIASLLGLALTACPSSTNITSVWVDDELAADYRIHDVLVIAYGAAEEGRVGFEDRFVLEFQERGATAITSHELIGTDVAITQDAIRAALAEQERNPDSVLLARLIGVHERRTYTPPAGAAPGSARHAALYDVTARDWGDAGVPGYYTEEQIVVVETTLWRRTEGEPDLIWSAETESIDPESRQKAIDDLADVLLEALEDRDFI